MKHLDLFSGIGGFAYAIDQVWEDVEHTFCEIDPFCQVVLKKHWPKSKIYGDIKTITNTENERMEGIGREEQSHPEFNGRVEIVTGGFPCQPFSTAGQRKGTSDNRHLWPQMFRVIQEFRPTWVIAENVYGLVTWNDGMVLEQVCTDLEAEGYEVQPFIIPACGVNAPHKRDRVWIIAHSSSKRQWPRSFRNMDDNTDVDSQSDRRQRQTAGRVNTASEGWSRDWLEVATELCSVDDGLPVELDGLKLSQAAHRREQLKAYGNAIVPQVAIEILKTITL